MEQPIILCGLGRVGWRVLEYLREAGLPVVAIDITWQPNDPRLRGVPLIAGDCRLREVLEQAGVAHAGGVLILSSDDLVNLSTVLMVRHLNPDVRVVVRLFNQNLIQRLGKAVNNVYAQSTSALTGPLLALTALTGGTIGTFTLEGGRRQVADLTVGLNSPIQGHTVGHVAARHHAIVLAHLPAKGTERFLNDVDPEAALAAGDHLVVCSEARDLTALLDEIGDEILPHLRWAGFLRQLARVSWRTLAEVDLAVKVCTSVLVVVVVISTLVYFLGMEKVHSVPDALYRTISVMATGGDMREQELTEWWQKVFVSLLRLFGMTLLAAFTALVTNFLLRARLGGVLEIRRIPDSGHVIVCGLGNIGFRVVEELLRSEARVVVIEGSRDSRFMATVRRLGVPVIIGDATVQEVLKQARAGEAVAVVACTSSELVNVEIALLARELNPHQRVVVRLSDPHLAQTLREAANVRLAMSISNLAAPAFLAALFGDRVQSVFLVGGRLLAVVELTVQTDHPHLNGQAVRALAIDYHLVPVALAGTDRLACPQLLDNTLKTGDRLTIIAALSDLDRLLRRERLPAEWAVELTGFFPSAREQIAHLLAQRLGSSAETAETNLNLLPTCLGVHLTRGQAEDLLLQVQRQGGQGRLTRQEGPMSVAAKMETSDN